MIKLPTAKLTILTTVMFMTACGGDSSNNGSPRAAPTPYLNVSVDEFYFGTRGVGTEATQAIVLSNRSADIYPIRRMTLGGVNAEEFALNFGGEITLNPSEKLAVDVSFLPLSAGLKNANMDIDYDIVVQGTAADSLNEQIYYEAEEFEQRRDYDISRARYETYMRSDPATANKQRAAIKLPVLNESQNYGDGPDFTRYVEALNARDQGDFGTAMVSLDSLLKEFPESYLADDALYLKGYIELMDHQDYTAAQRHMIALQAHHPESSYTDTAIYGQALALEKAGNHEQATRTYKSLLARHRSPTWSALNLNVAKDNLNSRMWFDRANQAISRIES